MSPVDQTRFGIEDGNCLAACIASLLELPLESVEIGVTTQRNWVRPMQDWLALRGLAYQEVPFKGTPLFWMPPTLCILSGPSPRLPEPYEHAVVGRMNGYAVEIVHDPHPSRAGFSGPANQVGWLIPLDPARTEAAAFERAKKMAAKTCDHVAARGRERIRGGPGTEALTPADATTAEECASWIRLMKDWSALREEVKL